MNEPCPTCDGKGFLLHQGYGYADMPNGWVPVQACDSCSPDYSDRLAAIEASLDQGWALGTNYAWFEGKGFEPDNDVEFNVPGDYGVRLKDADTAART